MIKVIGKNNISATIIADSINDSDNRLITYELEYPRFIHSEFMTHRMLSKNAASSRAIPFAANVDMVVNNPAMPIHWGKNQSGMQAKEELSELQQESCSGVWLAAMNSSVNHATVLNDIGLHKQITNRIIEPWSLMKTVVTGTEFENFFWLRNHKDAQPEIAELAKCMYNALQQSVSQLLQPGEWHLPYCAFKDGEYWIDEETNLDLETARMVSVSCCAQVSYRKLDDTVEKAKKIYSMLNLGSTENPSHASPCEHQGTPMKKSSYEDFVNMPFYFDTWEDGITHVKKDGTLWSANFKGWVQHRQLIPNESKQ